MLRKPPAALLAFILVLVAGCSNQMKQTPVERDYAHNTAQLKMLENWQASGKIALRNAQRSESASLTWSQQAQRTKLNLSGPLGFSAVTIVSDGSSMDISQAGNTRHYDISTPDAIFRETGWNLPLSALHYWFKGLPSPALEIEELKLDSGQLSQLKQGGWTVSYQSFRQFGQYTLPTKMQLEGSDTQIRLIIRNWTIEAG